MGALLPLWHLVTARISSFFLHASLDACMLIDYIRFTAVRQDTQRTAGQDFVVDLIHASGGYMCANNSCYLWYVVQYTRYRVYDTRII